MRRMHNFLTAEIPDIQMRLFAAGQRHVPTCNPDDLSLLLLAECVVNQPVDQRRFAYRAAPDQNEFGFEQRAFGAEVIIENVGWIRRLSGIFSTIDFKRYRTQNFCWDTEIWITV